MRQRRNPYDMLEDVLNALNDLAFDIENTRDFKSDLFIKSTTNMQELLAKLMSEITGELANRSEFGNGVLGSDIPLEDLQQSFNFVNNTEPLLKNLGFKGSSLLAFALYIHLDPIIQRMFRYFKGLCIEEGRALSDQEADLLELAVNLRNLNATSAWTLEIPDIESQIKPSAFDDVLGKRSGAISEVLMPRIPEVNHLRGLVRV